MLLDFVKKHIEYHIFQHKSNNSTHRNEKQESILTNPIADKHLCTQACLRLKGIWSSEVIKNKHLSTNNDDMKMTCFIGRPI